MTHGRGFQDGPVSRRSISLSRTLRSPSLAGPNDDCRDLSGLPEHWSPFEYQASASGLEMVVKTDSASSSPQCFARYEIGGSRTLIEGLLSGGRSPELVPAALTRLVRRDAFEWGRTGKAPPASWSSSTGSRPVRPAPHRSGTRSKRSTDRRPSNECMVVVAHVRSATTKNCLPNMAWAGVTLRYRATNKGEDGRRPLNENGRYRFRTSTGLKPAA